MKYIIFAGDDFYPKGGLFDYKHQTTSIEEALTWLAKNSFDWWQIVNGETFEIERVHDKNYVNKITH